MRTINEVYEAGVNNLQVCNDGQEWQPGYFAEYSDCMRGLNDDFDWPELTSDESLALDDRYQADKAKFEELWGE